MIANYFGKMLPAYGEAESESEASFGALPSEKVKFPRTFNSQFIKTQDLRYGENSHQDAALSETLKSARLIGRGVSICLFTFLVVTYC